MAKLTQPIKWPGGKHYLAPKIVALMPPHLHYVEPYAGGLSVLLERDPNKNWMATNGEKLPASLQGCSELVNDKCGPLTNFWQCLRDMPDEMIRRLRVTPLSRTEFDEAGMPSPDGTPLQRAEEFFVRARQSFAGTFKGFTSITRSRTRRGVNGNASEWMGAVEGLAAVSERLRPVIIENMDALKIIKREDSPMTLQYLDPPYLHDTRESKDLYAFEMTRVDHAALLELLITLKGKVMLSGYRSAIYDFALNNWKRYEFDLPNNQAGGDEKRRMTECLWVNF